MPDSYLVIRLALPDVPQQQEHAWSPTREAREELLEEADRLGVLPAVLRNLGDGGGERSRDVLAGNLWLARMQAEVVDLLAGAGIQACAVKGVTLASVLYPDLSWREVEDIDLVLDRTQVKAAFGLLRGSGWVPDFDWNDDGLSGMLARSPLLAPELSLRRGNITLELHWDWSAPLPPGDLLSEPERYLVYLCRHAAKHFWFCFKWSCDIELFRRKFGSSLDWDLFWKRSGETESEVACVASLDLCHRWFGGEPAPGLWQHSSAKARSISQAAAARLMNPAASASRPVWLWTQLRLAPWKKRLGLLWEWLSLKPQESLRGPGAAWKRTAASVRRLRVRWDWHRARALSAADWRTLLEAYATLLMAEAARRALPTSFLLRTTSKKKCAARRAAPTLEEARRMAWLVDVAANRQPLKVQCLARSLALAWMLKRRGMDASLQIGVSRQAGALQAHAWLVWKGEILHDPMNRAEDYIALTPVSAGHQSL